MLSGGREKLFTFSENKPIPQMQCTWTFSALTLLVWQQEGHLACKNPWSGCGGGGAVSLHYLPLLHKNPEELFLLVPAYPGGPGPKAVKRLLLLYGHSKNTDSFFKPASH